MPALTLSRLGRLALDLLYPPSCALCGHGGALVCTRCWDSMPRTGGRRCGTCWLPSTGYCRNCEAHPGSVLALRSPFRYEGPARKLVHRFKFADLSSLSQPMAPAMAAMVDWPVNGVVAVPLALARERQRGYNQSLLLARGIAANMGAPLMPALRRVGTSRPQARSQSAEERRRNVEGAFEVRSLKALDGLRLLLVDDVATTGATLDACARTLLAAGAREVTAVTFARED